MIFNMNTLHTIQIWKLGTDMSTANSTKFFFFKCFLLRFLMQGKTKEYYSDLQYIDMREGKD